MAQISRYTNGMTVAGGVASFVSRVQTLKASMIEGSSITAAQFNELNSLIAAWDAHTHSVDDLRGANTYGDGKDSPYPAYTTAVTLSVSGASPPSLAVVPGQVITAAIQNALKDAVEYFRPSHTHSITDTES